MPELLAVLPLPHPKSSKGVTTHLSYNLIHVSMWFNRMSSSGQQCQTLAAAAAVLVVLVMKHQPAAAAAVAVAVQPGRQMSSAPAATPWCTTGEQLALVSLMGSAGPASDSALAAVHSPAVGPLRPQAAHVNAFGSIQR